jgi:hypothetical protein
MVQFMVELPEELPLVGTRGTLQQKTRVANEELF